METTATTAGYLPLILSIAPIILLIWRHRALAAQNQAG